MDMKKTFLFLASALAGAAFGAPVWKAPPPDAQSALVEMGQAGTLRVDVLAENLFRVRLGGKDGWIALLAFLEELRQLVARANRTEYTYYRRGCKACYAAKITLYHHKSSKLVVPVYMIETLPPKKHYA